ncbi:hypothetical protein [Gandjariella thermophila]|uniref:Lipoprotein n=1 Tax=Gandjariella thermophila TaxID=1931992 RepID=A0A4D4J239_9PSEU|nr:hypothetical protein [Gandjariella thermophila]GDY29230.1 hypothetical protein GTS_08630 [Gandjariella thermophila]
MVSWFRVAACAGALTMAGFVGSAAACVHSHHDTTYGKVARPGYEVSARLLDLRPGSLRRFRSELRPHHRRTTPAPPTAPGPPRVPAPPSAGTGAPLEKAAGMSPLVNQPALRRE